MASVQKFTEGAVRNQLRHNAREIADSSNHDIEPSLSKYNYTLTPDHGGLSDYDYYQQRKSELYVWNRSDIKVLAGWVVTLPREITDPEQQREFFRVTYDFLEARYGRENVVQATVHMDEGKREKVFDRWGQPVLNDDGSQATRVVYGQPHLHFCFIPVSRDDNNAHVQAEKICAKEVLDRRELQHFHTDFQNYLDAQGIECRVLNGAVKDYGRNRTVKELKETYERDKELARLKEIERLYNSRERSQERGRW